MAEEFVLIKNLQGNVANRKLFYADQNDPTTFPVVKNKADISAGSELRVIEDGAKYILNSNFEWQLTPDTSGGGGLPDAPANGNTYGRKDNSWVTVDGGGGGGIITFSPTASYATGDIVSYEGMLWKATTNVAPGAFRVNQWSSLSTQIHQYTTGVSYAKGEVILVNSDPTAEGRVYGMYYADSAFTAVNWATDSLKMSSVLPLSAQANNSLKKLSNGSFFVQGEIPNKSIIYIDLSHIDPNAVYRGTQVQPFNTFAQAFAAYGSQTGVTAVVTNGGSATLVLPTSLSGWTFTALAQSLGGSQDTLNALTIIGGTAVTNIYFIGFKINTLTPGTMNTKSIHFESCNFSTAITLTTNTTGSEYSFLNCSFTGDVIIGGVGVFELNKCRFIGLAALTIKSSLKVLLIDNPRISVDQQGATQVIAQGSNTFVVPNNISSTYGYTCSTGTTAATTTIFLGGETLNENTRLPAPIYFLNGYAGTYSLGNLLFNAQTSNITPLKETLVGLAARQVVDAQVFSMITPDSARQSDINKAFDLLIKNLQSPGMDRGMVLNAFSAQNYLSFPSGFCTIVSGGSGYALKDVIFVQVNDSSEQLLKCWVIVESIGAGGTITSATTSSLGAYTVTQTGPFDTTTTGHGTGARINFGPMIPVSSTLDSIPDPNEGDRATVLIDETNNDERWIWQYADMNGDGYSNWVPLVLDNSDTSYEGDGVYINIVDGVITFDTTSILTADDVVILADVAQTVNGLKTFTTNIKIPSASSLPTVPSSTSPATEAQVAQMVIQDTTSNIVYGTGTGGTALNRPIDNFALKATNNDFTGTNTFTVEPELKGDGLKTAYPTDETGKFFATEAQLLNLNFDDLIGRPRANGTVMSSTTNLFIQHMAEGLGITLTTDGDLLRINSESYRIKRIVQNTLINNSISPANLAPILPIGYGAMVTVLQTTQDLPEDITSGMFGLIMHGNTTGDFYYMLMDTNTGVIYTAYGYSGDSGLTWNSQKSWYDTTPHPDSYDILEAPMFSYSDGTAVTVTAGEIQYDYDDWTEWGNIDAETNVETDLRLQWEEDGKLHMYLSNVDTGDILAIKNAGSDTAQTVPGTYELNLTIGTRIQGFISTRWNGLITVPGTDSKRVNLQKLHLLVQETQMINNDSFNELFATTEDHTDQLEDVYTKHEIDEMISGTPYQGLFSYAANLASSFPSGVPGEKAFEITTNKIYTRNATNWGTGVVVDPIAGQYYDVIALVDEAGDPSGKITYNGSNWDVIDYSSQLQADYAQTNSSSPDFIKNKLTNLVQDANYVHTDMNFTALLKSTYDAKQAALVGSGTGQNIKTVGGVNILGTGNIPVGGAVDQTYSASSTNAQSGTAVAQALTTILVNKIQSGGSFTPATLANGQWGGIY